MAWSDLAFGWYWVVGSWSALFFAFGIWRLALGWYLPGPTKSVCGDEKDAKFPWRPRVGAGSSVPISDSSSSPQPLGCDPPRLQEKPHIPVLALYDHDWQSSTEKTQNMGVGSTYNHNCLSFKAKVGKNNRPSPRAESVTQISISKARIRGDFPGCSARVWCDC